MATIGRRSVAFAVVAVIALASAGAAWGYQVYLTVGPGQAAPENCTLVQPRKLRWPVKTIGYRVQRPPALIVDPDKGEDAVHDSYATWGAVTGCDQPQFLHEGATRQAGVGHNPAQSENGVYWITKLDEWRYGPAVLALTTLSYSPCDGGIVDADIEVNAVHFKLSVGNNPPPNSMDVQNTMTHEVGHLLGLDHSLDSAATMYAQAPNAELSKRKLGKDDLAGLCCIYGANSPVVLPEGRCEGVDGSLDGSSGGLVGGGGGSGSAEGCRATQGRATSAGFVWMIGAMGAIWLVRRVRLGRVRCSSR